MLLFLVDNLFGVIAKHSQNEYYVQHNVHLSVHYDYIDQYELYKNKQVHWVLMVHSMIYHSRRFSYPKLILMDYQWEQLIEYFELNQVRLKCEEEKYIFIPKKDEYIRSPGFVRTVIIIPFRLQASDFLSFVIS